MGKWRIYGHGGGRGHDLDAVGRPRVYSSRLAAVRQAKRLLLGGYATRCPDGSTCVYGTLRALRRDDTGAGADYTVDRVRCED